MSETMQFVPCPGCRALDFNVLHDAGQMLARVLCSHCNRELLAVQMAPPNEPLNPRVAPI